MDATGRIYELPEGYPTAGQLEQLTDKEAKKLGRVRKSERRDALASMRQHPLAKLDGISEDDHRKLRNAMKTLRKERAKHKT